MPEPKREGILGRMWTKEELREWFANPGLAMGAGAFLMICGLQANSIMAVCGSILFGSGVIARAIKGKG